MRCVTDDSDVARWDPSYALKHFSFEMVCLYKAVYEEFCK